MKTETMNAIFLALASPHRRRMLDILIDMPGCNVNDVAKYFEMSRIAVMKHLKVLEEAELIVSEKKGRSREMFFNVAPIQAIHDRWSTEYSRFWAGRMMDIKYEAENPEPRPRPPAGAKEKP